jgi:nucleoside-diphosphate-sugar epimerase
MKLARSAASVGVQRFLVAGSCFEYGQVPSEIEFIDTTMPLAPTLSYPTSKAASSIAFEGFSREHGHRVKILRIFQVFGEGEQSTRMWPSLRRAALAGEDFPMSAGGQVRDFVPVEDVASSFVRHLDFSDVVSGIPQIRHVASGRSQTLLEFASHWWEIWNARGHLRPGEVAYRKNELFRLVPHPGTLA